MSQQRSTIINMLQITYVERVIRPAGAKAAAVLSKAMVAITVAYMIDQR